MIIPTLLEFHLWCFILNSAIYTWENWNIPSAWEWEDLQWTLVGLIPLVGELALAYTLWDYGKIFLQKELEWLRKNHDGHDRDGLA